MELPIGNDLGPKRILFVRDAKILDGIRASRRPHRCASCEKKLKGKQRVWCSENCREAAYKSSVVFDWNETRNEVLKRDKYRCKNCGRGPLSPYREGPLENWAECDHVIPVSLRPDLQFNQDNLRTLCHGCHNDETSKLRRSKRAEVPAGEGKGLNAELVPSPQQVLVTPSIPKAIKEKVKADLLQNLTLEQVAAKYTLSLNAVKGVWGFLIQTGIIAKGSVPGMVAPPPQGGPPPPLAAAPTPQPTQVQVTSPGSTATTVSTGPQVNPVQPPPGNAIGPSMPNGGPKLDRVPAYEVTQDPGPTPPAGASPKTLYTGGPMTLEATGVMFKIFQNPKTLMWFDFFKKKHPTWDGDLADFLNDSVEYFFKSFGYKMSITREEQA